MMTHNYDPVLMRQKQVGRVIGSRLAWAHSKILSQNETQNSNNKALNPAP